MNAKRKVVRSVFVVVVLSITGLMWLLAAPAGAAEHPAAAGDATGQIAIAANGAASVPSGTTSAYTINFECSSISATSCGTNPTITIPLSALGTNPSAMANWVYSSSSSISGLITSAGLDGNGNYVISLDPTKSATGSSETIQFNVTTPNNTTPNGTSWSLQPVFSSDDFEAPYTAPNAATTTATASANISTSKTTNDGGAVYVMGNDVIYNITARCNASGSTGNLYLTTGNLTDLLPSGLSFVSATPSTPTVTDNSDGTTSLEWDYSSSTAALPSGCSANGTGSTTYTVTAAIATGLPNNTSLVNTVTFTGTPLGSSTPLSTSANRPITAITTSPTNPFGSFGKTARGPLNIPNYGFAGTYPGNWIKPINSTPSSNPGSAEGEYTVNVSYTASRAFTTALADPVPCLDNFSDPVYSSNSPTQPVDTTVDNLCAHPAFDPTVVQVTSASLALAETDDNWAPTGIDTQGNPFQLTRVGSVSASSYFTVPSTEIGKVAAILLTQDNYLTDASMSMNVFGYGDSTLIGGDVLQDVATISAYPVTGGSPTSKTASAYLYIEPNPPQLGVYKSFGSIGAGPSGTTILNLSGFLATPSTPSGAVVITDLLPYGLSWANPPVASGTGSATFKVAPSNGGTSVSVTAKVEDISNFANTGRELIRVTLPASAFSSGFYTIKPPTNFVELNVPTAATTYNNTAQEFVQNIAGNTAESCGPGSGSGTSSTSTFQSSDPLDLSGDGLTNENFCSYSASLTVAPSGGPNFALLKTVQGDLDSTPKYPLGIGDASVGGSGVYTLTWQNTGGTSLKNPVIYDILPYVGDTGVSTGQATKARDSAFQPIFTGVSGSLPAGVTVEYSTSKNPCRPEVFPANPTCTDDWSTTPPADLSQVLALKFQSSGTYVAGSSFAVSIGVSVPKQYVNSVAWNSAAASAQQMNDYQMLGAEPPKVGLTAPAPALTPTLSTQISATQIDDGQSVTDSSLVGNTGGGSGTIDWQLVGPVKPNSQGTCDGLDWSGAATFDSGNVNFQGDGTFTTDSSTPTASGCYSYVQTLSGTGFAQDVTSAAGATNETVLVTTPTGLSVTKTADPTTATAGVPITYTITATNAGPGTAYGVLVTDKPVSDMKLLSVSTPQGTCNDSFPLSCEVGTIDAGQSVVIVAKAMPLVSGTVSNSVEITTTTPNTSPGDETHTTTDVHVRVDLGLQKRALQKTVKAGQKLHFQLIVSNRTDVPAIDVTVCDVMPKGLIFISASPHAAVKNGSFCWYFATIRAHTNKTITVITRALYGAVGRVVNSATLSGPDVFPKRARAGVTIKRHPPKKTPVTG